MSVTTAGPCFGATHAVPAWVAQAPGTQQQQNIMTISHGHLERPGGAILFIDSLDDADAQPSSYAAERVKHPTGLAQLQPRDAIIDRDSRIA